MLTGQSHVSQAPVVQVLDPGAEEHFSANESKRSLLSSCKGPGASHAGQDTTACESSLHQSSAGRSVSLSEQTLLTQTSGPEYSQPGQVGRVLIDREVSSALTNCHTSGLQADAGTSRVVSGPPVTFSDETVESKRPPCDMSFVVSRRQYKVIETVCKSNKYPSSREKKEVLVSTCGIGPRQVEAWLAYWNSQDNECKRSSEEGDKGKNTEKALPVTPNGDSPRVLSSQAECPSMAAGSPVETTTRHTSGLQAGAGACRIASGHPVTFSGETRKGRCSPRKKFVFNSCQLAILQHFFESKVYPSREEKEELARQCCLELRQVDSWFGNQRNRDQPGRKGNEEGNAEKALAVTPKEGSPRALSSRAACPSIAAGLPVETTTRHTSGLQAGAGACRIASTSSDKTGEGGYPLRKYTRFDSRHLAILESSYESNNYPSREKKNELAKQFGATSVRIDMWFGDRRRKDRKCRRGSEKGNEEGNTEKALPVMQNGDSPRVLSSQAESPSMAAAGSPEKKARHTPDTQADAGASRVAGNRPVTSFGKTRPGYKSRYKKTQFSEHQIAELNGLFNETGGYPDTAKKKDLAAKLRLDYSKVNKWVLNHRMRNKKNNLNGGENVTQVAPPGASRIVGGCSVILSDRMRALCQHHRIRKLSAQELAECKALYDATRGFPTREQKDNLANKLGLDSLRIDNWFKYTRKMEKQSE